MTKIKTVLTIFILLLFSLACSVLDTVSEGDPPADFTPPLTEADVPRVSVGDAKAAFDNDKAIIVDVRNRAAYDLGHAAGALSIPLNEFETDIASVDLPKDQWIITYCT